MHPFLRVLAVMAAAGKNEEAIAKYEHAIQLEGVPPSTRNACAEALKRLADQP